jgi:hypothetical protein
VKLDLLQSHALVVEALQLSTRPFLDSSVRIIAVRIGMAHLLPLLSSDSDSLQEVAAHQEPANPIGAPDAKEVPILARLLNMAVSPSTLRSDSDQNLWNSWQQVARENFGLDPLVLAAHASAWLREVKTIDNEGFRALLWLVAILDQAERDLLYIALSARLFRTVA